MSVCENVGELVAMAAWSRNVDQHVNKLAPDSGNGNTAVWENEHVCDF